MMVKIGIPSNKYQKRDKEVWATSGQGDLCSQIVKPITTALRQVTMRGLACKIKRVEI